jgi:cytochrome c-type biogenesis protein CcmH/NrfF
LWLGPAAVLLIGAFGLFLIARRHRGDSGAAGADGPKLTATEEARLSEILRRGE